MVFISRQSGEAVQISRAVYFDKRAQPEIRKIISGYNEQNSEIAL